MFEIGNLMTTNTAANLVGVGKRFDQGKIRHDLLPPHSINQLSQVLTFGAEKYGDRNWQKGMKWSKCIAALKRHLNAFEKGEDFDPETGLPHTAHLMCNAVFLNEYLQFHPTGDDRLLPYMRPRIRIGLDIDEVLADFLKTYCEHFDEDYSKCTSWNFDHLMKERLESLADDEEFWVDKMHVKTPASQIKFTPVCYITGRINNVELTETWLKMHGFPPAPIVSNCHDKVAAAKEHKLDLFVDDNYDTFVALSSAGITCLLYDSSHNQHFDVQSKRIKSLSHLH